MNPSSNTSRLPARGPRMALLAMALLMIAGAAAGADSPAGVPGMKRPATIGVLADGTKIGMEEYAQALRLTGFDARRQGADGKRAEDFTRRLARETWLRLAGRREAVRLGLTAGEQELKEATGELLGPMTEEQFGELLRHLQQSYAITPRDFEVYIRDHALLQKLFNRFSATVVVPPREVTEALHTMHDRFSAEYAVIPLSAVTGSVAVTEADARARFAENPTGFALPDQVVVRYVKFPFPDATNIGDSVRGIGETEQSVHAFIRAVYAAQETGPDAFDRHARLSNLPVRVTRPFARHTPVEGVKAGAEFNAMAFRLSPQRGLDVGDPVRGEDGWYVMALEKKIPAHVAADFSEASDMALARATVHATSNAIYDLAWRVAAALSNAALRGESASNSVAALGIGLVAASGTAEEIALAEPDTHLGQALFRALAFHGSGEISRPVPSPGALIVTRILVRTPADEKQLKDNRKAVTEQLKRQRAAQEFNAWLERLLDGIRNPDGTPVSFDGKPAR